MPKPANPKQGKHANFALAPYLPPNPQGQPLGIGLIGCGAISVHHLMAYREAGFRVVAFCDLDPAMAEERRAAYFPEAKVYADYRALLDDPQVAVADITTHPEVRGPLIADALRAGKHVLSQKPFVLDLDEGTKLADLADEQGVLLAVNQNARWAPHFSYIREAVRLGAIGEVASLHASVHWDHSWVEGTPFENIYHLMLYDFAIHWFDFLATIMGEQRPQRIYASTTHSPTQNIMPALMAQVAVEYPNAHATLIFDGHTPHGQYDHTFLSGSTGSLRSFGVDVNQQQVEVTTADGTFRPQLTGKWFPDGFHGTMGELLCAIEEKRQPQHSARNNLRSLELCFDAVASALSGKPVEPGSTRKLLEGITK